MANSFKPSRRPAASTAVAIGALVLAGGAIAWGATRASNSNVINACVDPSSTSPSTSNTLHLASASGSCAANQTPIQWNVQGPPGQPGAQGQQGPQGKPGSSGDVVVLPAANGGGGGQGVSTFALHVTLAAPGTYSVTGSAELTRFYASSSGPGHVLLGRCFMGYAKKRLRYLPVLGPASFTGNFAVPISLNVVASSGVGRANITTIYFRCLTAKGRGATLHNPSLTAIRLGP